MPGQSTANESLCFLVPPDLGDNRARSGRTGVLAMHWRAGQPSPCAIPRHVEFFSQWRLRGDSGQKAKGILKRHIAYISDSNEIFWLPVVGEWAPLPARLCARS